MECRSLCREMKKSSGCQSVTRYCARGRTGVLLRTLAPNSQAKTSVRPDIWRCRLTRKFAAPVEQLLDRAEIFAVLVPVLALKVIGMNPSIDDRFRQDLDFHLRQHGTAVPIQKIANGMLFGEQSHTIE